MITVYHYPRCGTCRTALRWLEAQGIRAELVDIVEHPPPRELLARIVEQGTPVKKLFNTSGELYRKGNYKERLATMSLDEALDELAAHGKLIKRPLVVGQGRGGADVTLVGFDEARYAEKLGG